VGFSVIAPLFFLLQAGIIDFVTAFRIAIPWPQRIRIFN
jgi:Flp pilus assembly protein TadG